MHEAEKAREDTGVRANGEGNNDQQKGRGGGDCGEQEQQQKHQKSFFGTDSPNESA